MMTSADSFVEIVRVNVFEDLFKRFAFHTTKRSLPQSLLHPSSDLEATESDSFLDQELSDGDADLIEAAVSLQKRNELSPSLRPSDALITFAAPSSQPISEQFVSALLYCLVQFRFVYFDLIQRRCGLIPSIQTSSSSSSSSSSLSSPSIDVFPSSTLSNPSLSSLLLSVQSDYPNLLIPSLTLLPFITTPSSFVNASHDVLLSWNETAKFSTETLDVIQTCLDAKFISLEVAPPELVPNSISTSLQQSPSLVTSLSSSSSSTDSDSTTPTSAPSTIPPPSTEHPQVLRPIFVLTLLAKASYACLHIPSLGLKTTEFPRNSVIAWLELSRAILDTHNQTMLEV